MIAIMAEVPSGTNGSDTTLARQGATDPRQLEIARELVAREIEQIDGGDIVGARAVLEMIASVLAP